MAGGDELGADAVGIVEQLAELEPVVAHHAGIGRARGRVLGDEIIDDPAELVLKIQRVERNVEPIGHAAGIRASVALQQPCLCPGARPQAGAKSYAGLPSLALRVSGP